MNTILSLPFHQYQRYKTAQLLIEAQRTKGCHTILEVGSEQHANLELFLPNDNILYLDREFSPEKEKDPRFFKGDGLALMEQFESQQFDFVVSLDVLEHVDARRRGLFLENINYCSKIGFLVSTPVKHPDNIYMDKLYGAYCNFAFDLQIHWAEEHEQYGLPCPSKICSIAERIVHDKVSCFFHANRYLTEKMLYCEIQSYGSERQAAYWSLFNQYYNDILYYNDLTPDAQDAIRFFIVYNREQPDTFENKVKNVSLFYNEKVVTQANNKMDLFLNSLNLYYNRTQCDTNINLQNQIESFKAQQINILDHQINNMNDQINNLNNQMDRLNQQISQLNESSTAVCQDMMTQLQSFSQYYTQCLDQVENKLIMSFQEILSQLQGYNNIVLENSQNDHTIWLDIQHNIQSARKNLNEIRQELDDKFYSAYQDILSRSEGYFSNIMENYQMDNVAHNDFQQELQTIKQELLQLREELDARIIINRRKKK